MNEFPKRSKASISKQTKQHILQAFNKIKEITHGEIRKVQNCRSSGGCFYGKSKSKIKLFLSAVQASVPEVCTKF
jgi:hypothetical protein